MELMSSLGLAALIIFVFMTLAFSIALARKDNSLADVAWGIGFIVVAFVVYFIAGEFSPVALLVNTLILAWGLRLAIRIYRRNKGKGEDFRYKKWRQDWGKAWIIRSYLQVFLLQGLFMFLISLPVVLVNRDGEAEIGLLALIGAAVWLLGFMFETIGDYQLDRYMADMANRGKVLDTGLWRYSRHPNYFGEVVQWWGIFIIGLGVEYGWLGIVGPVTISILILKVSGIPLLEKSLERNPLYVEYQRRTSVFWPLPPRQT